MVFTTRDRPQDSPQESAPLGGSGDGRGRGRESCSGRRAHGDRVSAGSGSGSRRRLAAGWPARREMAAL